MDSTMWSDEGLGRGKGPRGTDRGAGLREWGSSLMDASSQQLGCLLRALFLLHSSQRATCQVDLRGDSCSGWAMGPEVQQSHFNSIWLYFLPGVRGWGWGGDRAAAPAWEEQGRLVHNLLFMGQAWEDWDSGKVLDAFHTT